MSYDATLGPAHPYLPPFRAPRHITKPFSSPNETISDNWMPIVGLLLGQKHHSLLAGEFNRESAFFRWITGRAGRLEPVGCRGETGAGGVLRIKPGEMSNMYNCHVRIV